MHGAAVEVLGVAELGVDPLVELVALYRVVKELEFLRLGLVGA